MARIVKSGLIQICIPKSEGDGTIEEIKESEHPAYLHPQ
jgi:N-carbamoylputrescine amidase